MPGNRLYPTHMPMAPAARLLLTAGASLGAFLYPQRADLVAAVGELTGADAFRRIHHRMLNDPTGRYLLREKPLISVRFPWNGSFPTKFCKLNVIVIVASQHRQ
jgi:ubiquinone biosynthesis protein COQ4